MQLFINIINLFIMVAGQELAILSFQIDYHRVGKNFVRSASRLIGYYYFCMNNYYYIKLVAE
ncbi:hypothetical protein CBG25_08785 [Arsenophonus sp. ENCA]|nr:hypothetical protein CBG25_08785 [Arsenophonus sp. ENCA]